MKSVLKVIVWVCVAIAGAGALAKVALHRGEPLNATWFVVAAVCCYMVAYRFYSAFIAARLLALDDTRATPAEIHDDGRDFVPTNKWVLFGHHFAAIAGPGPLVGPTLAAQFGYLPGTLWLIVGAAVAGCVQDFIILFCSIRRDGKTLGQMAREEVSARGGFIAQIAVLAIMVILLSGRSAGRGERAEIVAVGDVYAGDDDSHRAAAGRIPAIYPAGARSGSFFVRCRACAFRGGGGAMGGRIAVMGAGFHLWRRFAGFL